MFVFASLTFSSSGYILTSCALVVGSTHPDHHANTASTGLPPLLRLPLSRHHTHPDEETIMSKRARADSKGVANGSATEASLAEQMIQFIDASPTPFHMCAEASGMLLDSGFVELEETDEWRPLVKPGGKYFFVRGGTLVAFFVGASFKSGNGFNIVGAHTDSPVLKLKPCSKKSAHGCIQINVETYGGGLWHTWFDRELTLAGYVIVKEEDGSYCKKLVHVKRPLLRIPNLCIHLTSAEDRGKFAPNKETHLQVCTPAQDGISPCVRSRSSASQTTPSRPRCLSPPRPRGYGVLAPRLNRPCGSQSWGSSARQSTSRQATRPLRRAHPPGWRFVTRQSSFG